MPLTVGLVAQLAELATIYRDLHEHPELSFQEERTAKVVADRLAEAGFVVTTGVGGTGVVGVLRNGAGASVLLRADMDALPVKEIDAVPYRSTATAVGPDGDVVPVMHACGHDTHVTALLGAAAQLAARRADWSGTVLVVFQPAEEIGAGARAMLDDGFRDRFPPYDVVLGQHVVSAPAGHLYARPGVFMAAADSLRVTVFGRAGTRPRRRRPSTRSSSAPRSCCGCRRSWPASWPRPTSPWCRSGRSAPAPRRT
jgi:amidohydrolase